MRRYLPIFVLALLVIGLAQRVTQVSSDQIRDADAVFAADVLPVYLSMVALSEGLDPTEPESLREAYALRGLKTRAATFSTLYPVTCSALLRPFAWLSWSHFVTGWRWLLLLSVLGTGLLAASCGRPRRWARWWVPAACALVLLWFPPTAIGTRLGQVNMALGLLTAGIMFAFSRGAFTVVAVMGSLGAAIKLVPGFFYLPLLAGRKLWAVAAGGALYLAIFAFASTFVSPRAIIEAILETMHFQDFVAPDWVGGHSPAPDWVIWFGVFRHRPLMFLSILLGGGAVLLRPDRRVMTAAAALVGAWLGTSAVAFHELYSPLYYPAWVYLLAWPFDEDAPLAMAVPTALVAAFAPWLLYYLEWADIVVEARLVMAGVLLWVGCGLHLVHAWRGAGPGAIEVRLPRLRWLLYPLLGLCVGGILARYTPERALRGPPLPKGQTTPEGAGFIRDDDPVPGQAGRRVPVPTVDDGSFKPPVGWGIWPNVAAGNTLRAGTRLGLESHLQQARTHWQAVARLHPAWQADIDWVLEVAPEPSVPDNSAWAFIAFLTREGIMLAYMQQAGVQSEVLQRSFQQALYGKRGERGRRTLGLRPGGP